MNWWLEASDVFHRHVLSVSRLKVLVQDGKNLIVEDLEFADSVDHLLQWLKGHRQYEHTEYSSYRKSSVSLGL